jgi:hypothetical protein
MFNNSLLGVSGLFKTIDPDNTGYVYIVNGAKRNKNEYRGVSRDILSSVQG